MQDILNVNPETVCFLVTKTREFHSKEEVVIPEVPNSPADDWGRQALADHIDDETLQEIISTINDLEPDQQHQVVALMWVGRGDFSLDEWDDAISEARENWTENTAEYLIAHPMVADYLLEGLDQLGISCEE